MERVAGHDRGGLAARLREVDPRAIDALLALVLSAMALVALIGRSIDAGEFRRDDVLGVALVLAQTLPIAARRAAPLAVLVVIGLAVVTHAALGYEQVQAGTFTSLIALYSAATLGDARRGLLAALISSVSVAAFFATSRAEWAWPEIVLTSATWALAWGAGTFARARRDELAIAGARAARLEVEREMLAREAVADERARMARELHDIVGHALNVIVIQAGGAGRVFETRPEVARDTLAAIEATGRGALVDMERMLGVLRATDAEVSTGLQPNLAHLGELAAHVTSAGIPVEVIVEGAAHEVPASVELSAYRIVQEALTNCLRHSGASRATVAVRYRPGEVEVEVTDDGNGGADGPRDARGGRGHLGMRERVALFGGWLDVGPLAPGRGYRVLARVPFDDGARG